MRWIPDGPSLKGFWLGMTQVTQALKTGRVEIPRKVKEVVMSEPEASSVLQTQKWLEKAVHDLLPERPLEVEYHPKTDSFMVWHGSSFIAFSRSLCDERRKQGSPPMFPGVWSVPQKWREEFDNRYGLVLQELAMSIEGKDSRRLSDEYWTDFLKAVHRVPVADPLTLPECQFRRLWFEKWVKKCTAEVAACTSPDALPELTDDEKAALAKRRVGLLDRVFAATKVDADAETVVNKADERRKWFNKIMGG
jgi:hypothetical protein